MKVTHIVTRSYAIEGLTEDEAILLTVLLGNTTNTSEGMQAVYHALRDELERLPRFAIANEQIDSFQAVDVKKLFPCEG